MEKSELAALANQMIESMRTFVARSESAINARLDIRLKSMQDSLSTERIIDQVLAKIPMPKDGKDADPVEMRRLVDLQVGLAVDAIPKPKDGNDGKDADPDLILQLVRDAVGELPKSRDGKDADPEVIVRMVNDAVAVLPRPKDGRDADPVQVKALVSEAVAAIPKPKDGVSVKGDPGKDGKNADVEMVKLVVAEVLPGMVETSREMLAKQMETAVAALPKPKDGKDIHPDSVALMIRESLERAVSALPKPKDGKDGDPGRDAAVLAVLPSIDETRSYPPGTYAKHNGGEIRAERRTDPVKNGDLLAAGWTVAREGIAAVVFTQGDDLRDITCAAMLTSGTKVLTTFKVPMILDRGVWREGEYERGDHVSWDGSGWIAQRRTTVKPGTSPEDWRLSTKRGRDGKDAEPISAQKGPVRIK